MLGDSDKKTAYWAFSAEYGEALNSLFVDWFRGCWLDAISKTNKDFPTCFTAHEGTDGIDLKTGKFQSEDDIQTFFD